MSNQPATAPQRCSLQATSQALSAMMRRLQSLLIAPLTEDDFIEILTIHNNVAYIFLYLEANEEHAEYEDLLAWRAAFLSNPDLDRLIRERIGQLRCADPEAEATRVAYLRQLGRREDGYDEAQFRDLLGEAKQILGALSGDRQSLADRLQTGTAANPAATFYRLVSRTPSPATRIKLTRAWNATGRPHIDRLITVIDRMVVLRREQARAAGFATPLAQTMTKSAIDEAQAEEFLTGYLIHAMRDHTELGAQVSAAVGGDGSPMAHFGYFMRELTAGLAMPLFDLDECLAHICGVASATFGVGLLRRENSSETFVIDMSWGGRTIGEIHVHLWGNDTPSAVQPAPVVNEPAARRAQLRAAQVSCRFQLRDGRRVMTFQEVHDLYHEFGHAMNHLLIQRRMTHRAGLEYLPLERLEYLSMWSEKWVFHPSFGHWLPSGESAGLGMAARIKALEHRRTCLGRAIVAWLDFELHRRTEGGLASTYSELTDRFGLADRCEFDDVLSCFTWPMFQANPGANFAQLTGAAWTATQFAVFEPLSLDQVGERLDGREIFAGSLDWTLPTAMPKSSAEFVFYQRLCAHGAKYDSGVGT